MMHGGQYVWLWKERDCLFRMDCFGANVTCPGLQRGELFAEAQKFLGFFDVFAAAGRMAKGTLEMIII